MSLPQQEQTDQAPYSSRDFVLPFHAHRDMLAQVGGKAANLGELTNVKFPVPPGFCVTTTAYELVAAGLQSVLDAYATSQAGEGEDAQRLTAMAQAARHCILAATIPTEIAAAITEAYSSLGSGEPIPVVVRSSATAEDLPFCSFETIGQLFKTIHHRLSWYSRVYSAYQEDLFELRRTSSFSKDIRFVGYICS